MTSSLPNGGLVSLEIPDWKRLSGPPRQGAVSNDAPSQWHHAPLYKADPELMTALEVAMALHQPLLLTGDPGCGKTMAAYWAAWQLGLGHEDLFHIQIRSDASAAKLKYEFDAVKYFRESQAAALPGKTFDEDRERFIVRGPLWRAFLAAQQRRVVLLLDEIDKAPRDFPNDLLHEFDVQRFEVPDWLDKNGVPVEIRGGPHSAKTGLSLLIFTSNGERRLPDAFLRRCVHHHLKLSSAWLREIINHRIQSGELRIANELVDFALTRFIAITEAPNLRHRPGLAELLIWLRVLAISRGLDIARLRELKLSQLPYLGTIVKDPVDREHLAAQPMK